MKYYDVVKWFLFGLFAVLQVLDTYSTFKALKTKGVYEANPVLRYLFNIFGPLPTMIVVKTIVLALIVLFFLISSPVLHAVIGVILVLGILWYSYAVKRNFNNIEEE